MVSVGGGEFFNKLTHYELKEIEEIKEWKNAEPSMLDQAVGFVLEPVSWLVRQVIPEAAIQGAIDGANELGRWLADKDDLIRDGKVKTITDLKTKDLGLSDNLADEVHNWAIGMAAAEGAAAGFFGIFSAPLDIPAIITLATRTIYKIGLCYGYECNSENDKNFVLGILAASGANSMEEKVAALTTLRMIEVAIAKQAWKAMAQKAAQEKFGKEAAIIAIKSLAKQLGVNLTKRKALQAIPAIGALVGGSVNGWYIKDVGWAARRAFQERWLIDNQKIIDI